MTMKLLPPPKEPAKKQRRKQRPKQRPANNGGRIFVGGVLGNRGGGRPPNEFREWLRTHVLDNPKLRANLQRIAEVDLAGASGLRADLALRAAGLLIQLASWAADRVEGKATQPVRIDPTDAERLEALRGLSNEELIAHLKTVDSETAHRPA